MASAMRWLAVRYLIFLGIRSLDKTESVTIISLIGADSKTSAAPPAKSPWLETAYISVAPPRSKIFAAFIPDRILYKYAGYQNAIILIVFVLLFIGVLSWPLSILQTYVYHLVMWITKLPFSLFI